MEGELKKWRRILGYQIGEKLRLKQPYKVPEVKEGEIGTVVNTIFMGRLGWAIFLVFSGGREIIAFEDEVEEVKEED